MMAPQPAIGQWYRRGDKQFEVVAVDEGEGTIELQYFDGTVDELDQDDWETQWSAGEIEESDEPEDWSGSVDVESDDLNEDNDRPAGLPPEPEP